MPHGYYPADTSTHKENVRGQRGRKMRSYRGGKRSPSSHSRGAGTNAASKNPEDESRSRIASRMHNPKGGY